MPERARVCLVTHPQRGAEEFARALVERRVAACVNLLPTASVYRWQGLVERADETLLIVKTRAERVPELRAILGAEHPYDVPECVVLRPVDVAPEYLAWLLSETSSGEPESGA